MNSKDKLKPMLFSNLKNYSGKQFVSDVVAGIIVAIIALPLSIALALASGVQASSFLFWEEAEYRLPDPQRLLLR